MIVLKMDNMFSSLGLFLHLHNFLFEFCKGSYYFHPYGVHVQLG